MTVEEIIIELTCILNETNEYIDELENLKNYLLAGNIIGNLGVYWSMSDISFRQFSTIENIIYNNTYKCKLLSKLLNDTKNTLIKINQALNWRRSVTYYKNNRDELVHLTASIFIELKNIKNNIKRILEIYTTNKEGN